ncbi:MAG TPA: SGNH/GDSL hydrolase family protein [Solirubrobacteraceae bacterium]|nr:SGNH/GDSL hydrolase family protein [Solirubrobacteraceae bacterium]
MEKFPAMRLHRTRLVSMAAAVALLAVCGYTAATVTAAGTPGNARYYIALGDSLSTGFQPTLRGEGIETHSGYVNDIYGQERRASRELVLVDFGCPGDTTTSLLTGVGNYPLARRLHCDRSSGSQLNAALAFLRTHDKPGQVPLITIDVGINDLNRCAALPDPASCLQAGEAAISTNLPRVLGALRAAAPEGTTLSAMTLYDTYLGKGAAEGASAAGAQAFLNAYRQANATIKADDAAAGFHTADVASAFDTYDTAPISWRGAQVPANLARTCVLTWSCSPPPINHNIHPDGHGYSVIARAFERAIGRLAPLQAPLRAPLHAG